MRFTRHSTTMFRLLTVSARKLQSFHVLNDAVSADWVAVPAMDTIRKIICRASSRVFVGLPKCRDPDYIELNAVRAGDIKRMIPIIGMLPNFLKP